MKMIQTFDGYNGMEDYGLLLGTILMEGKEVSPRGILTRELSPVVIGGEYGYLWPNWLERGINPAFSIAEFAWIMRGSKSLEEIAFYNSVMRNFSDDGETLSGSYGPLLFQEDGDQISNVIQRLSADKDSREAVAIIFRPRFLDTPTKDIPCTISLQFMIREDKLNTYVSMRSNDVVKGFPYDWATFDLVGQYVARMVGVKPGHHFHSAASFHLYENDFEFALRSTETEHDPSKVTPFLPWEAGYLQMDTFQTYEASIRKAKTTEEMIALSDDLSLLPSCPMTDMLFALLSFSVKRAGDLETSLLTTKDIKHFLLRATMEFGLRNGFGTKLKVPSPIRA